MWTFFEGLRSFWRHQKSEKLYFSKLINKSVGNKFTFFSINNPQKKFRIWNLHMFSFIKSIFLIRKWRKNKFFETSFNHKKSFSLYHKKIVFSKNGGVVVMYSFLLLRPPRTSKDLKKGTNFGLFTLKYA